VPETLDLQLGVVRDIPGGGMIAFADDAIWAVDPKDRGETTGVVNGDVYRLDPRTAQTTDKVQHARGGFPAGGEGALWLVNSEFGETVTRIDFRNLGVAVFRTSDSEDPSPEAVAVTTGAVWVGNNHDGTVVRVDPRTLEVTDLIRLTEPGAFGVRGQAATDGQSVWFGISRTGEIVRIDAATRREVSRLRLPQVAHEHIEPGFDPSELSVPEFLVVSGDLLYASTVDHVYVIDVATSGRERIVHDFVVGGFWAVALAADEYGTVWGLRQAPMEILRFATDGQSVAGRKPLDDLDGVVARLAVGGGAVWVRAPGQVRRYAVG
jgi:hypothetical protein